MDEDDVTIYRRRLPHWRLQGATYFVTWRLADATPDMAPGERQVVADALRSYHGRRYRLFAYVVMNDHVHVLVQPHRRASLETVVGSWKGFTGHRLAAMGRMPPVWQQEYFDRIVRDDAELLQKLRYIEDNPERRFGPDHPYPWRWSDAESLEE